MSRNFRRLVIASAGALAMVGTLTSPAAAESFEVVFPAGIACAGFDLRVEGTSGKRNVKEFTDDNGAIVRVLDTGKGNDLLFTNDTTKRTFALKANGSVSNTTYHADGNRTVIVTGHTVVFLYPTDVPAGPSTTLYVGRLVYQADPNDNFVLKSSSGRTTDICGQLGS
jgi:hypothetical protein